MIRRDVPAYTATVRARARLSPHLARVRLGGIRSVDGTPAVLPDQPADGFFGLWVPEDGPREDPRAPAGTTKRYYSIRRHDARRGTLDVDVVLHGTGAGARWGAQTRTGDTVAFDEPRGNYAPPPDVRAIRLCGDITALPAIARILEQHPRDGASPAITAVIGVDDDRDRLPLEGARGAEIAWVASADLVEATLALIPTEGNVVDYLWFSGEVADMRAVRRRLRRELAVPTRLWTTMGYWQRDSARWRARYAAAGPRLHARMEAIYADPADPADQADRAEELLEEEGLL